MVHVHSPQLKFEESPHLTFDDLPQLTGRDLSKVILKGFALSYA